MTTTPGPRTEAGKRLWTQIQGGVTALFHDDPVIGEAILAIEAEAANSVLFTEARADVDGLVALRAAADRWDADAEFIESSSSGTKPRRMVAAESLRACAAEVRALLAGDKAKAPHSLDGVTALDGGTVTPEDVAYVRRMQAEKARHE